MIEFILLSNKFGQTRVSRFYSEKSKGDQRSLESELTRICINRQDSHCQFFNQNNQRIFFRKYASLQVILGVQLPKTIEQQLDFNEYYQLEFVHLYVETLDSFYGNVCELDIIQYVEYAIQILNEMVVDGMVVNWNKKSIFAAIQPLIDDMEKD